MLHKLDITRTVQRATRAPEVANADAYPEEPALNAVVFDRALDALVSWDGERWVRVCTRVLPTAP